MSKDGRIGRSLTIIVASQVMISLQSIITMPIIIRMAGPAIYGANVLLGLTIGFLFNLMWNGIPYRYRRNLVSAATAQEKRGLFEPQFSFQVIIVAIVVIGVFLAHHEIEQWLFEGNEHFSAVLLAIWIVSALVSGQILAYFSYSQRFVESGLADGLRPYVYLGLLIGVVLIGVTMSLNTLMLVSIATSLCVSLPLLPRMLREMGIPRFHLPLRVLAADARLAWPMTLEMIVEFTLSISDRYFIVAFMSIAAVGQYQPAYTLASLPIFLSTLTDPVLVPAASRLIDTGARADAEEMVGIFIRLFMMMVIPFFVGALMVGPSLLALLATRAVGEASRWVVPSVAAAMGFYGLMRFASVIAFVLGRMRVLVRPILVGAAINVGLNLLLLPRLHDITVAGVTTLLGYAASGTYACLALRSEWRIAIDVNSMLRFAASALVMGVALWFLGYRPAIVADMTVVSIAIAIAVGAIAYFSVLWMLGGVGRREFQQFGSLLQRRITRGEEAS